MCVREYMCVCACACLHVCAHRCERVCTPLYCMWGILPRDIMLLLMVDFVIVTYYVTWFFT